VVWCVGGCRGLCAFVCERQSDKRERERERESGGRGWGWSALCETERALERKRDMCLDVCVREIES
jgi:hypothetical protein